MGPLTGLEFRITGPIEARLLPTPTLMLQGIEFGRDDNKVRARALHVEFALSACCGESGASRMRSSKHPNSDP